MKNQSKVNRQNETSVFYPNYPSGSFTHFKKGMPEDQKQKLLAMHKASRVNAGIYVAIVVAVYLILLTILLCRYARKHRNTDDSARRYHQQHHHIHQRQPSGRSCCRKGVVDTVIGFCCYFCLEPNIGGSGEGVGIESQAYPLERVDASKSNCGVSPSATILPITSATGIKNNLIEPVIV